MKLLAYATLILMALFMSACQNVEIVSNRNPDGTFRPANEAKNSAGESPDSWAMLYHYPSGNFGISAYSGLLSGQAPKLKR